MPWIAVKGMIQAEPLANNNLANQQIAAYAWCNDGMVTSIPTKSGISARVNLPPQMAK